LSKEELNDKEKFYIKQFNSKIPNGYNMTDGGDGNDGTIKPNLGKHLLEETKDKIRLANLGKKYPEEVCRKKSSSLKKAYTEGRKNLGIKDLQKKLIVLLNHNQKKLKGLLLGTKAWKDFLKEGKPGTKVLQRPLILVY